MTLAARTDARDTTRFTLAVDANAADLLAYVARRIWSPDDAAEVFNDTLLVAWRRLDRLPEDPEGARMWLFVAARNCVRNHERSRRRREMHETSRHELVAAIELAPNDEYEHVREAVRRLPPRYREVVTLVHWDGFSLAEAAELTGVTPSTARTRYARAQERLRRVIADGDDL